MTFKIPDTSRCKRFCKVLKGCWLLMIVAGLSNAAVAAQPQDALADGESSLRAVVSAPDAHLDSSPNSDEQGNIVTPNNLEKTYARKIRLKKRRVGFSPWELFQVLKDLGRQTIEMNYSLKPKYYV